MSQSSSWSSWGLGSASPPRARTPPVDVLAASPILPWSSYAAAHLTDAKPPAPNVLAHIAKQREGNPIRPNADVNAKVKLWKGDITKLQVDAVVNAANGGMWAGGGICGAIHSAAGPGLEKDSVGFVDQHGQVPTGETLVTAGHRLPARHVFHTVGPTNGDPSLLRSCYRSCLKLMPQHQCRSIAFPCIATGIFGFENVHAALVALLTVRDWLEDAGRRAAVDAIVFCVFLSKDQLIYETFMPVIFPISPPFSLNAPDSTSPTQSTDDDLPSAADEGSHPVASHPREEGDGKGMEQKTEDVPQAREAEWERVATSSQVSEAMKDGESAGSDGPPNRAPDL